MHKLFNEDSHKVCRYYFSDSRTTFLLKDVLPKGTVTINSENFNHIVVVLEGKMLIEYDDYKKSTFSGGEIVFIPAFTKSHIEAIEGSKVLIGTFDLPNDICNLSVMESLGDLRSKTEYEFTSVGIKPPMKQYLDLLVTYLESGIKCAHLHEIKEKEIFLIFRWYYTNEEFVKLFYPIIGKSLDFRAMVIKNYNKVKNISELASVVGMSRSNFDAKFKEVFGDPPKHWMLKRKAQSIRHFMSKPGVTINDVMIQYGFDSYTHFNRFCKQQFGKSPSELIKEKNNVVESE